MSVRANHLTPVMLLLLFLGGCCTSEERTYYIYLSDYADDASADVRWNQENPLFEYIHVLLYPDGGPEPMRPMIEIYRDDIQIDVPGAFTPSVTLGQSCPADLLSYRIGRLPAGAYTMVHRTSTIPEGYVGVYRHRQE